MKSIQTYLDSILNVDSNTSATILITLTVFFLGLILQIASKAITKCIERNRTRKMVTTLAKELSREVDKQSKFYLKSSKTFVFSNKDFFAFKQLTISSYSSIKNVGFQNIYYSFFLGFENWIKVKKSTKFKAFNRIWNIVVFIEDRHEKILNETNSFIIEFNKLTEKRNELLAGLRKLYDVEISNSVNKENPELLLKFEKEVKHIVVTWQKIENNTQLDIINSELVLKLKALNEKYPRLKLTTTTSEYLLKIRNVYNNQETILRMRKEVLVENYYSFRKLSKVCLKSIKILNNCG